MTERIENSFCFCYNEVADNNIIYITTIVDDLMF
jgi:hypothetical protein